MWQEWGRPSAVLEDKLMILLMMLFTVSEIALPIWHGRNRLPVVLQGRGRVVLFSGTSL